MFGTARKESPTRAISGGLPTFTPQLVAQAARRPQPAPRQDEPAAEARKASPAIQIDLGTALQGAVAVADFFVKRSAARRVAQRELEQTCLQLAQEYQGLLGVPDLLMRAQCDRKQAECCLQQLERASLCRYLCDYQQEALYVFPGFLPRQWECDYCQSRLPVPQGTPASSMCQCAGCGANMTQKIID
jgi:hypothetical protein